MAVDKHLDAQFRQRITVVEKGLLELNRTTIDSFSDHWIGYVDDLKVALDTDPECLSVSTITTSHALAKRVDIVVQTFLDLEALSEQLLSALLDGSSPTTELSSPETTGHSSQTFDSSIPRYLKPSYDWLLANIHNPYPSPSVRDHIARMSGAARKDVDNWFTDARKRVGWNQARKTHFSNKRSEIVDAATRFYANDEKLALDQDAELALVSIMKNAKDLYSDKFEETVLAAKLATVVKDLTPQTKAEAKAERIRQWQLKKDRDAYPSPDRSPEPTRLSPVPCDDEVGNSASQPISTANRKRQCSSVETVDVDQNEDARPVKRSRFDAPSSSPKATSIPTGLPSPAASIDESLLAVEASIPSPPLSIPAISSRKRRLSESDGQGAPKRPRNHLTAPRLQVVSDPLPLSSNLLFDESSFDGWFQQTFDRPEVGEISPSGFSVELGNLSDFDCDTPAGSRSTSPDYLEQPEQSFEPPTIEVADDVAEDSLWGEFEFWNNLLVHPESTTHPNLLVNVVGQEVLPLPLSQELSNFAGISQENCPSSDLENYYGLSNPDMINAVVTPLNPPSNEPWGFSESTLPPQVDACTFGKHDGVFGVNDGLFDTFNFDAGLLSPNAIYPTLPQDTVRQKKEKEYLEACEKARKLAAELGENLFTS